MKTKKEYLIDLELDPDREYSESDLKKQYKKLSVKYHEDKTGDSEKHRQIVEAYEAIKSEEYLPEEKSGSFVSLDNLHESLFSMIDRAAFKIDLKKSDNKIVKINNTLINFDTSKLTKSKTIFIDKGLYKIEK